MTNKTLDLMREYIRVVDMCKGTKLEGREWECVRIADPSDNRDHTYFKDHPNFSKLINVCDEELIEFALTIIKDKPVFIESELYVHEVPYVVDQNTTAHYLWLHHATWNKPTPKRTFQLNGVELPCPHKEQDGYSFSLGGIHFWFSEEIERDLVIKELFRIMKEATNK